MTKRFSGAGKLLALGLAVAATVAMPLSASARGWGGGYHGGYHGYHGYYRGGGHWFGGRWIAGALLTGAVVGLVGSALARRRCITALRCITERRVRWCTRMDHPWCTRTDRPSCTAINRHRRVTSVIRVTAADPVVCKVITKSPACCRALCFPGNGRSQRVVGSVRRPGCR